MKGLTAFEAFNVGGAWLGSAELTGLARLALLPKTRRRCIERLRRGIRRHEVTEMPISLLD